MVLNRQVMMKQSTIDIIDAAMAFNVSVQEDNLNLQEIKYDLLQMSRNLDALKSKSSFESVEFNEQAILNKISMELLSMIDSSIVDLDKKMNYPHFLDIDNALSIMYNAGTIVNIVSCLRSMLTNLVKLGNETISYEELRDRFLKENELDIVLTNTHISDEDYVEMNIPQPKLQSIIDANMDKDKLNTCSKILNSVVDSNTLKELNKVKYELSSKFATNRTDAIKSAHFIAQVTMAIKNAILLMQNYHNATLNELA